MRSSVPAVKRDRLQVRVLPGELFFCAVIVKVRLVDMYVVYVLYSPTIDKFYIGSTSDLEKRIYYHNNGKSPYTRKRGPWSVVYQESYQTRNEAIRRERELKNWKSSKRMIASLGIDSNLCGDSSPT